MWSRGRCAQNSYISSTVKASTSSSPSLTNAGLKSSFACNEIPHPIPCLTDHSVWHFVSCISQTDAQVQCHSMPFLYGAPLPPCTIDINSTMLSSLVEGACKILHFMHVFGMLIKQAFIKGFKITFITIFIFSIFLSVNRMLFFLMFNNSSNSFKFCGSHIFLYHTFHNYFKLV